MSDIKIHCSYCEQKLAVPLELVGSDIECPSCKNDIKVPIKEDSEKSSNKVSIRNKPGSEAIAKTNIPALTKGTGISKLNANVQQESNRKFVKPMTKVLRDLTDNGELHRFIPDKAMLALSVVFILPGFLLISFLGVPFVILSLIMLAGGIYFNTLFFIKGSSWVCDKHVGQNPALLTVVFTNSIEQLIGIVLQISGFPVGLRFLLGFFINIWIFELRLKRGYLKALLISLIIVALNIVLFITLGCAGAVFFGGMWLTQQ